MFSEETEVGSVIKALPDPEKVCNRFLRCTTCTQCVEPPELICRNAHPICRKCCQTDQDFCAYRSSSETCMERFVRVPMGMYKMLHEESTFHCPNRLLGCPFQMEGKHIKAHLEKCDFRNLANCVFQSCNLYNCILEDYHLHLTMDHGTDTIADNTAQIRMPFNNPTADSTRSPYMFRCFDATFLLTIHEYEGRLAIWISIVRGPPNNKYKATFRFTPNESQEHKEEKDKVFHHEIQSVNATAEDVVELCECMDLSLETIKSSFLIKDSEERLILTFGVLIERLQCELDDEEDMEFTPIEDEVYANGLD